MGMAARMSPRSAMAANGTTAFERRATGGTRERDGVERRIIRDHPVGKGRAARRRRDGAPELLAGSGSRLLDAALARGGAGARAARAGVVVPAAAVRARARLLLGV